MNFLFFFLPGHRHSAREGGTPPEGKDPLDEKSESPAGPEPGVIASHPAEAEPERPVVEGERRQRNWLAHWRSAGVILVGLGVLAAGSAELFGPNRDTRQGVAGDAVPVLSSRSVSAADEVDPSVEPMAAKERVPGEVQELAEVPAAPAAAETTGEVAPGQGEGQGGVTVTQPANPVSPTDEKTSGDHPAAAAAASGRSAGRPSSYTGRSPSTPPRLAVVIDDWGYDWPAAREILSLKVPLTAAILPFAPRTREQAEAARQAGFEVILHMPMEPFDGSIALSAETLRTSMSEETLKELVRRALRAVPQAVGVSNHQGSRATSDARVMRAVLEVVRQEGLFFLDSRTSRQSVAVTVARQLGVPAVANRLFIDNDADVAAIEARLWEAVELARREGQAIVIGHVHGSTANALARTLPEIQKAGIELVTVSALIGNPAGQPGAGPASTPAAPPVMSQVEPPGDTKSPWQTPDVSHADHPGTDAPSPTTDQETSGVGEIAGQKANELHERIPETASGSPVSSAEAIVDGPGV